MSDSTKLPSPSELTSFLSSEKELSIETGHIKRKNLLAIAHILLPAALNSAAAGNVTMREAIRTAWPYIKSL